MFTDIELRDFVIVGIDPGISNMGMSAISVSPDLTTINYIHADTSHGDKAILDVPSTYTVDARFTKLLYHSNNLTKWLLKYRPSYISYEEPFIHGTRPTAYGALVESVSYIKSTSFNFNPNINIYGYTPLNIKKTVHTESFKGKGFVLDALNNINEIKNQMVPGLDEHSIDAIAIAYTHLVYLRKIYM